MAGSLLPSFEMLRCFQLHCVTMGICFAFLKIDQLFFGMYVKEATAVIFQSNSCLSSPVFPLINKNCLGVLLLCNMDSLCSNDLIDVL